MKELISKPIGADGGVASIAIDAGMLELKVGYPVAKIVEPLKSKIVDKLKAFIPGTWDDVLIDKAWAELVAELSDAPVAPAMIDVAPPQV